METKINSNQLADGGSGGQLKILNVVQTGTLTRDGAIFSGFSGSNYLQFGARVDNNILSLDSSTYVKAIANFLSNANNWDFITCININSTHTTYGTILGQNNPTTGNLRLNISPDLKLGMTFGSLNPRATTAITAQTDYYIKFSFTGTSYDCYFSLTGEFNGEETLAFSESSGLIVNDSYNFIMGVYQTSDYFMGSIDISKTYIKANGEIIWKGVETLTL